MWLDVVSAMLLALAIMMLGDGLIAAWRVVVWLWRSRHDRQ